MKTLFVIGVSAFITAAAAAVVGDPVLGGMGLSGNDARAAVLAAPVDRTRKSDRLPIAAKVRAEPRTISTVEVVGVRDAAIVYRDRDGRVLYQSDPLTNATLVSKGVVLPEVTVREKPHSVVRPVETDAKPVRPVVNSGDPVRPASVPTGRLRIPEGCDPAASPIASPQLSHILSKCLVEGPVTVKVASLLD